MKAPAHVAIGTLVSVALARFYPALEFGALHYLVMVVGSLSPDIDGGGSITRPGKILQRFLPYTVAAVLDGLFQTLSRTIGFFSGHRGACHWPAVGFLIIACAIYTENFFLFWFGFGYLSHILADACTIGGVPLLGPFSRERFSWVPLRTGSPAEWVLTAVLWCIALPLGFPLLNPVTQRGVLHTLAYVGL